MFFLDIYNQVLNYDNHAVSIIFDSSGDVWFCMNHIFAVLEYNTKNPRKLQNDLAIPKEYIKPFNKIQRFKDSTYMNVFNQQPHQKYTNESGLSHILVRSQKPKAQAFLDRYYATNQEDWKIYCYKS